MSMGTIYDKILMQTETKINGMVKFKSNHKYNKGKKMNSYPLHLDVSAITEDKRSELQALKEENTELKEELEMLKQEIRELTKMLEG